MKQPKPTDSSDLLKRALEMPEHEFQALLGLYNNKQQWVRHYETLLTQITPLSTTASLGIAAYVAQVNVQNHYALIGLIVPLTLIAFTIWYTRWCDMEIRRQFDQIISAEKGMGFYEYWVDGKQVLPNPYQESADRPRPIVYAGYILQIVSLGVLIYVGYMQFSSL